MTPVGSRVLAPGVVDLACRSDGEVTVGEAFDEVERRVDT